MKLPQRDENGTTVPHDHEEILANSLLVRRIDPNNHIVPDENRNCKRISTKAFRTSSGPKGGMSVDLNQLMVDAGIDAAAFVTTPKHIGSVSFSTGAVRSLGLWVGYDPIINNEYHGEVWTKAEPTQFSKQQQNALRNACSWFVQIPGVEI